MDLGVLERVLERGSLVQKSTTSTAVVVAEGTTATYIPVHLYTAGKRLYEYSYDIDACVLLLLFIIHSRCCYFVRCYEGYAELVRYAWCMLRTLEC